ncbi:hypothetical protein BWD42_20030 [Sphingobacterium sp. CZ-UAM]|jgi:hypothetical protein|nr:hypothetical protein BWD42_20030 [Sphingobacterium sp. CZ-UAM]
MIHWWAIFGANYPYCRYDDIMIVMSDDHRLRLRYRIVYNEFLKIIIKTFEDEVCKTLSINWKKIAKFE